MPSAETVVVKFAPNVIKDDSPLNAEGGIIGSNNMRNRQGAWQTTKGWQGITDGEDPPAILQLDGPCRGMHTWADLNGTPHVAMGTADKLFVMRGGELLDITPAYHSEGILQGLKQEEPPNNAGTPIDEEDLRPFKRVSATVVEVRHSQHGLVAGDSVTFSHGISYGSGPSPSGTFTVVDVLSPNAYTIAFSSAGTVGATGGGNVTYQVTWRAGVDDGTETEDASVWSLANYGEALLAVRKGSPLYVWYPNPNYDEIWVDTEAALGTGWSYSAGTFTKTSTDSNLSLNVKGFMTPGKIYRVNFTVNNTTGGSQMRVRMNYGVPAAVADIGNTSLLIPDTADGAYSRLIICPADPSDFVFSALEGFAGTLSAISLKPEARAVIVDEAPKIIDLMWTDPANHIVCAAGTFEADGDYNPLVARNTSQDNFRDWIPDTDNLADEFVLGNGSRVIGVCPTRQQTLIFTDDGVISQQFIGSTDAGTYGYRLLGTGCGLLGKNAVDEINGQVFWWANNGNLYTFQGAIPQIIQSWRFRRDANDNLAQYQAEKVFCWINSENNEVWWHYPDARDAGEGAGECSRVVAYNWIEDHSVPHMMDRTAGVSQGLFPHPILVASDGGLYYHEVGNSADTANFAAYLDVAWSDLQDGHYVMKIDAVIPDFQNRVGNVLIQFFTRDNPNAPVNARPPITCTAATQRIPTRVWGRQMRIRIYSNAPQSFWVLGALKLEAAATGARR